MADHDDHNPLHTRTSSTTRSSTNPVGSVENNNKRSNRVSFDANLFGKPVSIGDFLDISKKTLFAAHKVGEVEYALAPEENDYSYFREDAEGERVPIPEHINAIGKATCVAVNTMDKSSSTPIYDVPVDDPAARIERVKGFEESFKASSRNHDDFDAFEPVLREEETILCSLNCSEIQNFPSTTHRVSVKGLVKVAIVKHETDGLRLLFSVAEGSKTIKVEEDFFEAQTVSSCICCCVSVQMSNGSNLSNSIGSGMRMQYSAGSYFGSQFSTLPVSPCVVDSVCYRMSVNEREAHTADANAGSSSKGGCCSNIECVKCDCKCPCECTLPVCCGFANSSGAKSIHFHAEEVVPVVQAEAVNDPIVNQKTISKNGVQFRVNAQTVDDVFVTVHYRSLMDNKNHSCHMRMVRTMDPAKDYNLAKLFVSILGHNRNRDLKDQHYWNVHPAMDFQPIYAPSLYNRYDGAAGVDGLVTAATAGGICATITAVLFACNWSKVAKVVEFLDPCLSLVETTCFKTMCPCVSPCVSVCRRPF